jgi:hypothetical protein
MDLDHPRLKASWKKGLPGVISSGKYEKFFKVLVNAGQSDEGYAQVIRHDNAHTP